MGNSKLEPSEEVLEFMRQNPNQTEAHKKFGHCRSKLRQWRADHLGVEKAQLGRPRTTLSEEVIAMLGHQPDYVVASQFSIPETTVRRARHRLNIPSSRSLHQSPPDALIPQLGKSPDYVLAAEFSLSTAAVRAARRERGIEPYKAPPRKQPVDAPKSTAMAQKQTRVGRP